MDNYGFHYDLWYIDKERKIELIKWSDELKDRLSNKKSGKQKRKSIIPDY